MGPATGSASDGWWAWDRPPPAMEQEGGGMVSGFDFGEFYIIFVIFVFACGRHKCMHAVHCSANLIAELPTYSV